MGRIFSIQNSRQKTENWTLTIPNPELETLNEGIADLDYF
jgi:hypothetical protein